MTTKGATAKAKARTKDFVYFSLLPLIVLAEDTDVEEEAVGVHGDADVPAFFGLVGWLVVDCGEDAAEVLKDGGLGEVAVVMRG